MRISILLFYPQINAPIEQIDANSFVLVISFFELHHGIDVPDALLGDRSKILLQLAD
jgi:hypothetical protein